MLVDTHCHIDFHAFDADRAEVIAACYNLQIRHIIVPSTARSTWDKTIHVCAQFPALYPALGLHPYFIEQHTEGDIGYLEQYCINYRPLAIGEIGLDFYRPEFKCSAEYQKKQLVLFRQQLQLAQQLQLPVIIHARKSHQQVLECLKRNPPIGGVVHAFNGSLQQAFEYIKFGFKLGFGGAFCNPNAKKLRTLVTQIPLQSLVLETDAPDMLPFFAVDKRNSPENIAQIFTILCRLRSEPKRQIELQLFANSQQLFPDIK